MRLFRQELRAVLLSAMFFTRLPLPSLGSITEDEQRRSAAYCPLIGWLVGGMAAASWWLAAQVFPSGIACGLNIAIGVLLTGAMHEDGLADVCDGFGGGTTKERILEIMQDSRVGSYALVGCMLVVGLKWQALAALPAHLLPGLLIAGHALSRGAAISLMATMDYVRIGPSKARGMVSRLQGGRLMLAVGLSLVPLLFVPMRCWWSLLAVVLTREVLARWFRHRIGGYTGDCLGCVQQLTELAFLLCSIALAHGW